MERGAWQATVCRVTKNWAQLNKSTTMQHIALSNIIVICMAYENQLSSTYYMCQALYSVLCQYYFGQYSWQTHGVRMTVRLSIAGTLVGDVGHMTRSCSGFHPDP